MQKSSSNFGLIAILSTIAIIILISLLGVFSFLTQPTENKTTAENLDTNSLLQTTTVDPALAVAQLGGLPALKIVQQATDKARPGTALTTLAYTPNIPPQDAVGALLLLGNKFNAQADAAHAQLSFEMAANIATLSPDLSDTLRADVFIQAGNGMATLENTNLAKLYFDQAYLIATESNYLQAAYRRSLLEQLNQAYLSINQNDLARRSLDQSLNPADLNNNIENKIELPVSQTIPLPLSIQSAEKERWEAAQAVVKNLVEMGGEVRPENLSALTDALLKEDTLKTQFFEDALNSEQQLSGKVNIVYAKINWQSIKYRIARQGFGISLVPEWENSAEQIRADLTSSYETLFRLYSDIIVAIPDASQIDRATEEALRRQLLAGKLGLYPNFPVEQLQNQLLSVTAQLVKNQPGIKLRVSFLSINGKNYCILVSDKDILNQKSEDASTTP